MRAAPRSSAQADEASARASVEDARAALANDETNLSKASIRSPIDGVVLTRSVEPGNAVAASLQAVTLFTVAEDLGQLQLQVNVDEADVGAVRVGQKASFTVSAYPSRRYPARITRVAFGSTKTDNVVTYTTWMQVDNADLSLRPGMTAAATITATERTDVLLVPNTALRFTPVSAAAAPAGASAHGGASWRRSCRARPGRSRGGSGNGKGPGQGARRQVWVLQDGKPRPWRCRWASAMAA
jgi:HlyD family secretion protein